MHVVIDGVEYCPVGESGVVEKIGIAITTRNRNKLLEKVLAEHEKYRPSGCYFVVVDDGSNVSVLPSDTIEVFRFPVSQGIAIAKNKCLELLMDAGCKHLFLFDDDIYPKVKNWEKPYLYSHEPHLSHSWGLFEIYRDSQHIARDLCGGTMLYYDRDVIADTGGMRTIFGRYGAEHVNLSDRIHNRGWTTWRYADVVGAKELFYEYDQYESRMHKSVADRKDMDYNRDVGIDMQRKMKLTDAEYVEYREMHDVVITTMLTSLPDPQNGRMLSGKTNMFSGLADSIQFGKFVVLNDCFTDDTKMKTGNGNDVQFVNVVNNINPYFGRWVAIYQYLRGCRNVGKVWCVDATDVVQLRDPFSELEDGVLYIGQEQSTLANDWIIRNHNDADVMDFIKENKNLTLLNPGTVGGDYAVVLEFAQAMMSYWFDGYAKYQNRWKQVCGIGDMAATQKIGYEQFAGRLFYGASVNTLFKGEKKDEYAMWKHK